MPRRRKNKARVVLSDHAQLRIEERLDIQSKKVSRFLNYFLSEQLGAGIRQKNGAYMMNLPENMVAPLEGPDLEGRWRAITVKPK